MPVFDSEIERYLIRSLLIVDGEGASSARIAEILSRAREQMPSQLIDATVSSLEAAKRFMENQPVLVVIIDPGIATLDASLSFIEAARSKYPHIIWVLYCHKEWWSNHSEALQLHAFGQRLPHYFSILKEHTGHVLRRDLLTVLLQCQADFALQLLRETVDELAQDPRKGMTQVQCAKFVDKATRSLTRLIISEPMAQVTDRIAFVSMPFDARHRDLYTFVISPLLIKHGYKPIMMDEQSPTEPIATAAFKWIGLADLVLADLTGSNPNVLFELGVAYSGAKRVIRIARKGTADENMLPFMVRGDKIVFYDNQVQLKGELDMAIPEAKPWAVQ